MMYDYQESKIVVAWDDFVRDIILRFQELGNDDIVGEFNKLGQVGTVVDYQEVFEELKTLVLDKNHHLTKEYTSSFISGLKEELKLHVLMFAPKTLSHAIFPSRMQETLLDTAAKKRSTNRPPPIQVSSYNTNKSFSSPVTIPRLFSKGNNPSIYNNTPQFPLIKRLTFAEMKATREKGLYYNCDEVYLEGHKCIKQQLYMIGAEDKDSSFLEETSPVNLFIRQDVDEEVEISVLAMSGNVSYSTIKIQGEAKMTSLSILIDNGNTHSFLNSLGAKRCGSYVEPTTDLLMAMDDGNKLVSEARCPSFKCKMQGQIYLFVSI